MKLMLLAALGATLAMVGIAEAGPSKGRLHAQQVKQQVQNQDTKASATYRDGRITKRQADLLRSRLRAVAQEERRAEHNGEISDAQYRKFEAQLGNLSDDLVAMETRDSHAK
ncbi:MAG: hypothetical protein ACHP84_19925 [Caulobacterales bacterium]